MRQGKLGEDSSARGEFQPVVSVPVLAVEFRQCRQFEVGPVGYCINTQEPRLLVRAGKRNLRNRGQTAWPRVESGKNRTSQACLLVECCCNFLSVRQGYVQFWKKMDNDLFCTSRLQYDRRLLAHTIINYYCIPPTTSVCTVVQERTIRYDSLRSCWYDPVSFLVSSKLLLRSVDAWSGRPLPRLPVGTSHKFS